MQPLGVMCADLAKNCTGYAENQTLHSPKSKYPLRKIAGQRKLYLFVCNLPGHGGHVLSHATELANNLLHAFLAAQDGRVHVLDTLCKVVHRVGFCEGEEKNE